MRFTKVGYSRTFPLEQFGNEKPFVEIELEEGESPMYALNECKKLVHEFHQQTLAELEAKSTLQVRKTVDDDTDAIKQMNDCNDLKTLIQWNVFVSNSKNPLVKSAYQNKFKSLANEPK